MSLWYLFPLPWIAFGLLYYFKEWSPASRRHGLGEFHQRQEDDHRASAQVAVTMAQEAEGLARGHADAAEAASLVAVETRDPAAARQARAAAEEAHISAAAAAFSARAYDLPEVMVLATAAAEAAAASAVRAEAAAARAEAAVSG